jgi:hypothetical protein
LTCVAALRLPSANGSNQFFPPRWLATNGIDGGAHEVWVVVAIGSRDVFALMPRKPPASHNGAPFCISHVAAVCRSVCDATLPCSVEMPGARPARAGGASNLTVFPR